jgi:hypothetical protein
MCKYLITISAACLLTNAAFAQDAEPALQELDASSILVTVYKIALSTSNLCTNPTTIFESSSGVQVDLKQTPTMGKGKINNGMYHCLMVEVSKIIRTAASTTQDGNPNTTCTTAVNRRICADNQASKLVNGTAVTCLDAQNGANLPQRVTLFFTTLSTNSNVDTLGANTLLPPQSAGDTTHGLSMSGPITYPTNKKARLRLKKKILVSNSNCDVFPKPSILVE